MVDNIVLATDSYKLNHWNQYPHNTEGVYSYFEARKGAEYPYTVFFGLQYIIKKYLMGRVVTQEDVNLAESLASAHFGGSTFFNKKGWQHIIDKHDGKLPIRIKAVPEGSVIPIDNVMMTVENTDPECFWLTNALESILTHVWYSSTVATLSRHVKDIYKDALEKTAESADGLPFMLHDFGYRGATSQEAAAIGGASHLVNFVGTDTLPAILCAMEYYQADIQSTGFSVAATEHSVMTARGREGELEVIDQLLAEYPDGILSVVGDSYNIYNFVEQVGTTFKQRILDRDGKFVVRPDSVTGKHPSPQSLVVWILESLWESFGGTTNSKGFKALDPKIGVLWGDGIGPRGISHILGAAQVAGFSAENLVFGMGGGLLQKVNRDTQRFAFKSSSQKRDGEWHDIFKEPLDETKKSKQGRLILIKDDDGNYRTLDEKWTRDIKYEDQLQTVFENGELLIDYTFDQVRENAS